MILNRTTQTSHPAPKRPLLNNKAYEVFENAGSGADLFMPGLEDHYENLAASFLEQWTKPTASSETPQTAVEPTQAAPSSTELGWQLAQ